MAIIFALMRLRYQITWALWEFVPPAQHSNQPAWEYALHVESSARSIVVAPRRTLSIARTQLTGKIIQIMWFYYAAAAANTAHRYTTIRM